MVLYLPLQLSVTEDGLTAETLHHLMMIGHYIGKKEIGHHKNVKKLRIKYFYK